MPELMRRNFHTQMAQDRFVDRDRNGSLTPWLAVAGEEQVVRLPADHCGRNLVAINLEAVRQNSRELELEVRVVLRFLASEDDERRLARALRPMQVRIEV